MEGEERVARVDVIALTGVPVRSRELERLSAEVAIARHTRRWELGRNFEGDWERRVPRA